MNRTRISSLFLPPQTWGLGSLLLAAALVPIAPAHAQTVTVTVTDLTPTDLSSVTQAQATGVSGSAQAGFSTNPTTIYTHALLWQGTANSAVDLNPTGFLSSQAIGVSGSTQVGFGSVSSTSTHALLWTGTAASAVDLNPDGFDFSNAYAVSGDTQVGDGYSSALGSGRRALLWHGTADSVVDLNPAGAHFSQAFGVFGDTQVGTGPNLTPAAYTGGYHALLWHGTPDSAVDLNPEGFAVSQANAASKTQQVGTGFGTATKNNRHAVLWRGTAESAVDLNPTQFPTSYALGVSGGVQVGFGSPSNGGSHAVLWTGTPQSAIDLNHFLPTKYRNLSQAFGVDAHGNVVNVVGYGVGYNHTTGRYDNYHAFLWHLVFSGPPTLVSLDPASRTVGRGAFPLSVNGSGFTANSVITWNGAAQATTLVSPFEVTANIPASLIAQVGTAQVAVVTSGISTAARTETINPRPVMASISPGGARAGSAAFTLTVEGRGFLSRSLVKWNGKALSTQYVSATRLTATVAAALVRTAGTATVTVTTPQVATSSGGSSFFVTH